MGYSNWTSRDNGFTWSMKKGEGRCERVLKDDYDFRIDLFCPQSQEGGTEGWMRGSFNKMFILTYLAPSDQNSSCLRAAQEIPQT